MAISKTGKATVTGVLDPKGDTDQLKKKGQSKEAFVKMEQPIQKPEQPKE